MITGFQHTGFVVNDLDAMVQFYQDALGLRLQSLREVRGGYVSDVVGIPDAHLRVAYLVLDEGGHFLELIQYLFPKPTDVHSPPSALGAAHLCVLVDDLEGQYQRLQDNGVRFVHSPITAPSPLGGTMKVCYARDPEGNWLEFKELVSG